jgi:cell division protein FtsB
MARNRRNQAAAVKFGPALKVVLVCLALGGAGIGYVGLKNQIHDLSRQIERKEKSVERLREENAKLGKQLATLRSPPFLHARVNELNLGLVPPQPAQIIRLQEPPVPAAAAVPETATEMARRLQLAAGEPRQAAH